MHTAPETRFRFPRTPESRKAAGFLKLLTAVDVHAPMGLQFSGQVVTPGAEFELGDLPRPAVLLENAGSVRVRPQRSRYSWENLWLLWEFDFDRCRWREVVRAYAPDAGWTVDFAPIAERLLFPVPRADAENRARPVTEELAGFIHAELQKVSREERCYVLAGLEQHIASEIVRVVDSLSILKIGFGSNARFPPVGAHLMAEADVLRPRLGVG